MSRDVAPVLAVQGLAKRFGALCALQEVGFTLQRGEVLGLLGPNGAGKSTTMKIITGALAADGGSVTVCGIAQDRDPLACRRLIGYLPEELPLYLDMRVADYLDHLCRLKGIARGERRRQVVEAMARADCSHNERRRIRTLSKGNRQRVALAGALLGEPPLLILDEPTSGLDPAQVANFRDLIRRLAERHAIVLSTHILAEVDAVCDRVAVIHRGRIILDAPIGELRRRAARVARVRVRVRSGDAGALQAALAGTAWARVSAGDSADTLLVDAEPAARGDLVQLVERHGGLAELSEERVPLEAVFRDLVA
ncbi:MAG: ABC transporter ATP-binding protein [Planctomycetota bacterium]|nr:ABC transporter ATP-binding protein [Planctomycetota bacterium]MCX8040609.1 ABC transporter ATP-binding protein [Planctomycetota bacterium]MDW8373436.1 ABC transporter ATP-binding protein [Planctomycetota bacterium]